MKKEKNESLLRVIFHLSDVITHEQLNYNEQTHFFLFFNVCSKMANDFHISTQIQYFSSFRHIYFHFNIKKPFNFEFFFQHNKEIKF